LSNWQTAIFTHYSTHSFCLLAQRACPWKHREENTFLVFADYSEFVKESRADPKIEVLSEVNNIRDRTRDVQLGKSDVN
jgi:hypothetical protein